MIVPKNFRVVTVQPVCYACRKQLSENWFTVRVTHVYEGRRCVESNYGCSLKCSFRIIELDGEQIPLAHDEIRRFADIYPPGVEIPSRKL